MVGEQLLHFDLALGGYVAGQIRPALECLPTRPFRPLPALNYRESQQMTLSQWLGRGVAVLPPSLSDHLWAGASGNATPVHLSDNALGALELLAEDPPMRAESECYWEATPAVHLSAAKCVPEIREALTRCTAEEWAEASSGFGARLSADGLPLASGIGIIRQWLRYTRGLRSAICGTAHSLRPGLDLPAPAQSTPDQTSRRRGAPRRRGGVAERDAAASPSGMLTPAAVSKRFAVSLSLVYAACRSGALAHYRVPARADKRGKYLMHERDVTAWLESLRVETSTPTPSSSAPASSGSQAEPFCELNAAKLAKAWKPR